MEKSEKVARLVMRDNNNVLADNDVDAADLHLLLVPTVREAHAFMAGKTVIEYGRGMAVEAMHHIWHSLRKRRCHENSNFINRTRSGCAG